MAIVHDALITLGLLALFGREFNLVVVAALLTLVGYSVNDTVVVFDRVRENLKTPKKEPLEAVINRSINQTLSRTLLTSGATMLVVVALFFLGGEVLHTFALTLIIGIIVGTYSSIYVAAPIVVIWKEWFRTGGKLGRGAGPRAAAPRRAAPRAAPKKSRRRARTPSATKTETGGDREPRPSRPRRRPGLPAAVLPVLCRRRDPLRGDPRRRSRPTTRSSDQDLLRRAYVFSAASTRARCAARASPT